ncbi:MAG TPA: beta/gamma crystallin-related protein [Casimicrobiaceae bacterium]|nr:beta/gamma crystallin-related protein [Casimicrobiaceae bacterium]
MKRTLVAVALIVAAAGAQAAELTLFGRPGFEGPRFKANDSVANLDRTGFNDRASSAVIRDGVWQLCDDAYFRGHCVTLQPGRYPSLREMGLNNRVSSAREAGFVPTQGRPNDRGRDRGVGAVLFSNSDFRGDRYVVQGNYMRDLANTGFNDRAQSLRVERGYWIFCSDADFQGQCRTFGPGDYRRLPRALDNKISSGRRISERYPYNGQPNWER